jgi:hypothetical protein
VTLRVSADLLDLKAAPFLPGPSLGVPEREVESRLRPALSLDKPRIGGGSQERSGMTRPVTGAQKPEEEEEEEEEERV